MASVISFDAFHDRLVAAWTATPLVFENEKYDLPDIPSAFVYVEIWGDDFSQESFGAPQANHWVEHGTTSMHVMIPSGDGTRQARVYAGQLLALFREQPIGTLVMPDMSIGEGSPGKDFPNYFALTASIHWSRRETTQI